jgi:hypothetical protein
MSIRALLARGVADARGKAGETNRGKLCRRGAAETVSGDGRDGGRRRCRVAGESRRLRACVRGEAEQGCNPSRLGFAWLVSSRHVG